MDVLQVSKYYYPVLGGIEDVVKKTAEGLEEHDVSVLCANTEFRNERDSIKGVPVERVANLGELLSVPMAPTFPLHLWKASAGKDLLHYHLPNPLSVVSHELLPSKPKRTVVTYHSDIIRQSTALRFYEPLLHRFLSSADRILVTSPLLLEYSDHLGPYADKCEVVPLCIDPDEYGNYSGPSFSLPGTDDDPTILFVGRLCYYKGGEYLIDAMRDVEGRLLIAGDGPRRDELEARVERYGLESRVHFLGRVSEEKLHYCYDRADLFVLPSVERSEAFGIVQLEAMAYSTPVINTDLPSGAPWVSQHGETGLTVPPRNANALAEAITELVADGRLRGELGERARDRVEDRFSCEARLSSLAHIYTEI